jgi:hypothetical protein
MTENIICKIIMKLKLIGVIDPKDQLRREKLNGLLESKMLSSNIQLLSNSSDLSQYSLKDLECVAMLVHAGDKIHWNDILKTGSESSSPMKSLIAKLYNPNTTKLFWFSGSESGMLGNSAPSNSNHFYIWKRAWFSDFQLTDADISEIINYSLGFIDYLPICCSDYFLKEKIIALSILCQGYLATNKSTLNKNHVKTQRSSWWLDVLLTEEENSRCEDNEQKIELLKLMFDKYFLINNDLKILLQCIKDENLSNIEVVNNAHIAIHRDILNSGLLRI